MLTSAKIKKYAKSCGADLVGIGSMDRFEGAPKQMDLRYIFPDAKSIIAMGFRHFRGLFRGIEEGTFWTAYPAMGYAGINYIYQPLVLWNVAKMIEDEGYEAVGLPNNWIRVNSDFGGQDKTRIGKWNPRVSNPVSPDKPAPDIAHQLRIAAFCCGLGEIGFSKMFLSPEFGPRQRLAVMLTDAPLKPDPLFSGKLCDKCKNCLNECTVKAIPKDEVIKVKIAGRKIEWADVDMAKCAKGFCGGSPQANPFVVTEDDKKKGVWGSKKMEMMYWYSCALEGASGCIRACMIHLEEQGKLKNKFKNPFRKRKPWILP
ncbi:MAG: hypothetical protein PHR77_16370 [Kiritimatiellae bacterium]|nr:hypothetical protein [Kiritimatiellia bacterium]MDD5522182.1 hypothetical protein [Kiritimatiellia bacterium]